MKAKLPLSSIEKKTDKGVLIKMPNSNTGFWYPRKFCGYSETDTKAFELYFNIDYDVELFDLRVSNQNLAEKKKMKASDVFKPYLLAKEG